MGTDYKNTGSSLDNTVRYYKFLLEHEGETNKKVQKEIIEIIELCKEREYSDLVEKLEKVLAMMS